MGGPLRETTVPAKMSREALEALVIGLCDHHVAALEQRVAELERKAPAILSSYDGGAQHASEGNR